MKKIPSLFKRNYEGQPRLVYNEVVPGCEWVLNGDGVATRKFDGTACWVSSGLLYKRYDLKKGRTKPDGFIPAQPKPDEVTGHWPGWVLVGDGPDDKWHREAFHLTFPDGTYELCGPKIQGNPEEFGAHVLVIHGVEEYEDCPVGFETLKSWLGPLNIEGIVWHHPDGRMAKIKTKDFYGKRDPNARQKDA